jgi:2,4-dienoyl-CoA reductase-like NADH-dependent reductase (Old Yellow Enzyme family)
LAPSIASFIGTKSIETLIGTLEGGRSVARASTIFESDASPPTPQCRRYPRLFEPLQIGSVGLRNRLFKTAAESCFIDASGGVEPALLNYYESIAAGGVGLVIVESPTIDFPISMTNFHGIRLDEDRYVDGLARLADVIHRHQCPAFVQLHHAGPWHLKEFFGLEPISVSATRECELPHFTPAREITLDEIAHVVGKFADAAERVKAAGFDGVEINAAASHLLGVFLSRAWNRRSDEYGPQDLESRSRIVRQIIQAIKQRNGPDFPVTLIMNGLETGRAGSMTLEESRGIARLLEQAGADAIQALSRAHGREAGRGGLEPRGARCLSADRGSDPRGGGHSRDGRRKARRVDRRGGAGERSDRPGRHDPSPGRRPAAPQQADGRARAGYRPLHRLPLLPGRRRPR